MKFSDIVSLAKEYLLLSVIAALVFVALFYIVYAVAYKKLLNGVKTVTWKMLTLIVISIAYSVIVMGGVLLDRHSYEGYASLQLHPLHAYAAAWNQWSIAGWRHIVLNILLFVPFGFLLILWSKKLQKGWKVVVVGFICSLFIESTQLITNRGIFDVNDIIHNTVGAWLGYGLGMLLVHRISRYKVSPKKLFSYGSPVLVIVLAASIIHTVYSMQELGNLSTAFITTTNMKNVKLHSEIEFSNYSGSASIYKVNRGSMKDAKQLAQHLFNLNNTEMDEAETQLYDESAYFYSLGRQIIISVTYRDMSYRLTDFSGSNNRTKHSNIADKEMSRKALANIHIDLPEGVVSEVIDNNRYKFTANMIFYQNQLWDGFINVEFYDDLTIKSLENNMIAYDAYQVSDIVSEADAYQEIVAGKFLTRYMNPNIMAITVKGVELSYELDTKGFFQPVYLFECKVIDENSNAYERRITISALK